MKNSEKSDMGREKPKNIPDSPAEKGVLPPSAAAGNGDGPGTKGVTRGTFSAEESAAIWLVAIFLDLTVQLTIGLIASAAGASTTLGIIGMGAIQIAFFVTVAAARKLSKRGPAIGYRRVRPLAIVLAPLLAVVCAECFVLPAEGFSLWLGKVGFSGAGIEADGAADMVLLIIISVFAAPAMEELLLRGVLLGGLCKRTGGAAAIFLSALAFSLMHMNPEQTVYQFMLGAASAYLALSSGSLLPSFLLHATNNVIALLDQFVFAPRGIAVMPTAAVAASCPAFWAPLGVLLFAVGVAIFLLAGKLIFRSEHRKSEERGGFFAPLNTARTIKASEKSAVQSRAYIALFALGLIVCAFIWTAVFAAGLGGT